MSREKGFKGETLAKTYLENQGYRHLHSNFYSRFGELDLIMEDPNGTIVVIEAKAFQANSKLHPLEAVTKSKLEKIRQTLRYFWIKFPHLANRAYRVDVIAIQDGTQVTHVQNVLT